MAELLVNKYRGELDIEYLKKKASIAGNNTIEVLEDILKRDEK